MRPRLEVVRRGVIDEDCPHRRGRKVVLVHRLEAENLLDRTGHVDLGVEGAVFDYPTIGALEDVGADDIARAAVTVHVVNTGLRIIFRDKDRRRRPDRAVADGVDKTANGQVVIGLHGCRGRLPAGVVGADPHELQLGHGAVGNVVLEILIPDIEAILVGDAQVELRVVLDGVVHQVRERRVGSDGAVVLELRLQAILVFQYVVVKLRPARLAAIGDDRRGATRRVEGILLDILAVVLQRDAGAYSAVPQVSSFLVRNRIAAVGGVIAEPIRRLDVVGVGCHGLHDPVVTVGRLAARVVVVVEQREALHQRVRVGRDDRVSRGVGRVDAEGCQGGVAVAADYVAQDLIVGAVFTDDQEHVLNLRGRADLGRDCHRRSILAATFGGLDIFREIPVVVLSDLRGQRRQVRQRKGNNVHRAEVLVGVEVVHAELAEV